MIFAIVLAAVVVAIPLGWVGRVALLGLVQEKRPFSMAWAAILIKTGRSEVVQIDDKPEFFLARANTDDIGGNSPLAKELELRGWKFHDQFGAVMHWTDAHGNKAVMSVSMFTRDMMIAKRVPQ